MKSHTLRGWRKTMLPLKSNVKKCIVIILPFVVWLNQEANDCLRKLPIATEALLLHHAYNKYQ